MPLIETKGAASAQGFGEFAQQTTATYIEDVFSTWLTTGAGANITVVNGIDLAGKGGLVWNKTRNSDGYNTLFDTNRGVNKALFSNDGSAETTISNWLPAFNSNGFEIGTANNLSGSGTTGVSWTFRKQPKFFDIVTYTGTGSAQTINHNLGSVPGCIMIKTLNTSDVWRVYHRSIGNQYVLVLNSNIAQVGPSAAHWNNTDPTATQFTVGTNGSQAATTYVAYLFAHDAGGFGLTGTDNVISCGTFTTDGTGKATVTLGYEPQWIIAKRTNSAGDWYMADVMRGMPVGSATSILTANLSAAEYSSVNFFSPTATGFLGSSLDSSAPFIYVAIRRGPMKVPTSGTSVFSPVRQAGGGTVTTNFVVDASITKDIAVSAVGDNFVWDRLRGSANGSLAAKNLITNSTAAESAGSVSAAVMNVSNTAVTDSFYGSGYNVIYWNFRRAPKFFDVVCYTGNGTYGATQAHNLGAVPELIIVKGRSNTWNWGVGCDFTSSQFQYLNLNSGADGGNTNNYSVGGFFGAQPTTTIFTLATNVSTNQNNATYVAYLFATCAGVSKVGKYTGTGALQTINCGFTGGARWVMIKRLGTSTDPGIGDWYVYDSARGISSGNDPYLFLNTTAAEVTGTNYVDTTSVGFQVTAAAPAGLNANGGTYIFLAIA
jgi:hypothetical protein